MKRSFSGDTLKCPSCGSSNGACPEDCPIQMYSTKRQYFNAKRRKLNDGSKESLFEGSNSGINFDKYLDIPVRVDGDKLPSPWTKFELDQLGDILKQNILLAKYDKPTPVQQYALPLILAKRDVMACAQTGSGKTAAFLFPMIAYQTKGQKPLSEKAYVSFLNSSSIVSVAKPIGVVLSPTRELAEQIYEEAKKFTFGSRMRALCVYGGSPYFLQEQQMRKGADILVATPGRLMDFLEKGKIDLSETKYFCLDEADRMLDMGFEEDVRKIASYLPGIESRVTIMFSATFPSEIRQLAEDFLNGDTKTFIRVGRVGSTTDNITQIIKLVTDVSKKEALLEVLEEAKQMRGTVLVFVALKKRCQQIGEALYKAGFAVASIHGDRQQIEREAALEAFRDKRINILVATSVAARGLDIDHITHVVNYDFPENIDEYVHRIGRTGRAGNIGKAISFITSDMVSDMNMMHKLHKLLQETKQKVPDFIESAVKNYRPRNKGGRGGGRRFGGPRGRSRSSNRGRGGNGRTRAW
eukprot:TRINITY_DN2095_c0_g1_i2.p1 TRINITY_DN2095_c0_g1~~TRINITY_DN2095_c0_g1_i2.p1  ORF type:complete len:525 (+),score=96.22 TRINITY_DN2095_c0_g1_i2:53-1627(+)